MPSLNKSAAILLGALAAATPAWAAGSFQYIPAKQVAADVADMSKGPAVKVYFRNDNFSEMVAQRDKTGQVELHKFWNDYIMALSGSAKLTVGGTPVGMKDKGKGESLGDSITGGQTVTLHPGDAVIIPAGLPHWMQLDPGAHFRYLIFKTKN